MNPLKNPDAEACAREIAAVIHDKLARQALFAAFLAKHPTLKNWEGQAIGGRAVWLARQSALEAHGQTAKNTILQRHSNAI